MSNTSKKVPPGAWDSHVHVIDEDRWKIKDDAPYHPKKATLEDLLAFERTVGVDHVCIVAISVYGTDNASIVDALRQLNGKGRGVACIDPETVTDAELDEMHAVGMRGVRLNLRTRSEAFGKDDWAKVLHTYADKLRRLDWAIQMYVSMDQIALVAPTIPELGLRVVFDHLGSPEGNVDPSTQPGCAELKQLLQDKQAYVKLSGTYRMTKVPGIAEYVQELLRIAPTQIVWASDWPHTGGVDANPGGDTKALQDFQKVDMPAFAQQCIEWCGGDEELIKKIWVDNPRRLWDYPDSD